jgi:NADPH:quinone reductase-like Zn-dependent oxidoreductase
VLLLPTYRHGTWASHLIAATTDIVVVPDDIDTVQLAMVGINPITALLLLRNYGDPSMDDRWIGQTTGNSAVGEYLIKLAAVRLENPERGPPRGRRRAGPQLGWGSGRDRR